MLFSQATPKFVLTKEGVKPVVLTFDASKTASMIFTRLKTWNAENIKYPKSTIRSEKENTQIKFGGYIEKGFKIRDNNFDHWYNLEYNLNVEIKDGRCRVNFETPESRYKVWFNQDGSVIKKFAASKASFEASINELLNSINTHIKNNTPKKTEDNW